MAATKHTSLCVDGKYQLRHSRRMTQKAELTGRMLSVVAAFATVMLAFLLTLNEQMSRAQYRNAANNHLLIARGYTDATNGTVTITGDVDRGGRKVIELRIKEGQRVSKGEMVAVLSEYPRLDIAVGMWEIDLKKMKLQREALLAGPRVTEIAISEAGIKSTIDQEKLATLNRQRSARPADQKELEVSIAERNLANQRASVELAKR